MAAALIVIGALLQFLGVVALAWPDLVPWKDRLSAWLGPLYKRVTLGLPGLGRRPQTHSGKGHVSLTLGLSGTAVKTVSRGAPLSQQVAFLLDRDEEAQKAEQALKQDLQSLDSDIDKRLEALQLTVEAYIADELRRALGRYRPLRLTGAILLAFGLILTTLAVWA